ncbi:MAG: hypothetical protein WKG52_10815 [Variovorax sp.]
MQTRNTIRNLTALSLLVTLAGISTIAQAEQVWARVVSVTPVLETTGSTRYNVTYEHAGRQYTTRTDSRPGASIPIEVGSYGVARSMPVAPQPQLVQRLIDEDDDDQPDWNQVTPEPGVVISGRGPAPIYGQPVPVYTQRAPAYYPAPVYVQPGYAYPQPYIYPPVGISLGIGYSRGWGGGYRGGGHGHGHGHGRWR